MHPELKAELTKMDEGNANEALKKLNVAELLAGLVCLSSSRHFLICFSDDMPSPLMAKIRRTWRPTNFGRRSPFLVLVSIFLNAQGSNLR